ncbi:MAG: serine hydrolase [Ignavibacteria bacterium]|jgi:beta-lactamase class A
MPLIHLLVALAVSAVSIHAQSHISMRLNDVCAIFAGKSVQFDTVFSAQFLEKVPPMQLRMIVAQVTSESGPCSNIRISDQRSAYQVFAEGTTANGWLLPFTLTIESTPPHRIAGLFVRPPVKPSVNIDSVVEEFRALPGKASLMVADLSTGITVASHASAERLPIGSTFKLYVLGALVTSMHKWEDITHIDSTLNSLPSGVLQSWPHGSPVTLHTLACQMISVSDNTATDHLLNIIGRDAVQRHQAIMGHSAPEVNDPFLSTREMFLLKFCDSGSPARAYASAETADRRAILRQVQDSFHLADVSLTSTPVLPDSVEWFASTAEIVRALDWFRIASTTQEGKAALDILEINPGLQLDRTKWQRVCFKGGSETGVINMSYLLQDASNKWYAVSASWLNTEGSVDDIKFAGLIDRTIRLLAP